MRRDYEMDTEQFALARENGTPYSRLMDDQELRAVAANLHPGEVAVIRFAPTAGLIEIEDLETLARGGALSLLPVPESVIDRAATFRFDSARSRQFAFRVEQGFSWVMFWKQFQHVTDGNPEDYNATKVFENISVFRELPQAPVDQEVDCITCPPV